jgi:hypothetical protein
MKVFSIDWHTKKEIVIYDGEDAKKLPNSSMAVMEFLASLGKEKCIFIFEAGGGDFFKIAAYRAGHTVLYTTGKSVKQYRDSLGVEKDDVADAVILYDLYTKWAEETIRVTSERTIIDPFSLSSSFRS